MISTETLMKKPILTFYALATDTRPSVPMADVAVHAGFPCPVDDAYMSQPIDLNKELIQNPSTTYLVRVAGDSMIDEGIDDGDMLVVDRGMYPSERHVSVVMIEGEFALKRIVQKDGKLLLMPGNDNYPPIVVDDPSELRVFGVVRWVMKRKF